MNLKTFLDSFGHIADAPGGVDVLRRLVLDLAVRGRLTEQTSDDEPAARLLKRLASERARDSSPRSRASSAGSRPVDDVPALNLPTGWARPVLTDVAEVRLGRQRSPKNHVGDHMRPYIRAANVTWAGLDLADVLEMNFTDAEMQIYRLERGDIVLSEASGSPSGVGKPAMWNGELTECAFQNTLIRVRPFGADPHYLLLYFRAQALLGKFIPEARGVGINHLGRGRLAGWRVPVPPLHEQHRIVERARELLDLCDELEQQQAARTETRAALTASTLNRISEIESDDGLRKAIRALAENIDLHLAPGDGDLAALSRVRQGIVDLAVRGRLTHQDSEDEPASGLLRRIAAERGRLIESKAIRAPKEFGPTVALEREQQLPRGWEWARAASFFVASDSGWSPQCLNEAAESGEWGVLKTSAVSRRVFDADENKKLPSAMEPRPQLEVRPGQFVMIRASGSKSLVGRGAIVTEAESHLMLSDKHIRLTFVHEASTRFWAVLNDSTAVQSYYSAESSGTSTMSNVTRDRIGSLVLAVPPLAEQQRIADRVELLLGICDDLEQQLVAAAGLRHDLSASVSAHAARGPSAA